ncbi:MAG: hypothetical protein R3312_09700 [Gammaproteobacteria bacterium]|nr:hypothetical protein [Gammaproteobacteria bacterium]
MSQLEAKRNQQPRKSLDLLPAEPLWKRAPGRDEEGRALSDFMMIIPGLCRQSTDYVQNTLFEIEKVLKLYGSAVVFAEMNLKINTLWVTVRPVPGICLELPAVLKYRVPEALLVAHKPSNFR